MTTHAFEPELDQPLPRVVRLRPGREIGFIRLFSVLWLGGGGFAVLGVVGDVAVPGTVVNLRDAGAAAKPRYRYHADVEYVRGGKSYNASDRLSAAQFAATAVGQPATVHTHPLSPAGHRVEWPDRPEGVGRYLFMAVWTVGWAAASVAIVGYAWYHPWRDCRLVSWGTPAAAVVTEVQTLTAKNSRRYRSYIWYRIADPLEPDRVLTGSYSCKADGPDDRPVGATVTVLLDPDRPQRHVALAGSTYLPVRTPDGSAVS